MAEAQPKKDKTLSTLHKQVNQTLDISDVLAGRKTLGGRLGKKLQKQQQDESSLIRGKQSRITKFKEFDKYLERMEFIANDDQTKKKITIKRAIIQDPKNPDKII